MTAQGINRLSHGTRSLTKNLFAIHLSIADQVLRKNLVEFFAFPFLEKLLHLQVDLSHLDDIFAEGSLIKKRRTLISIRAIDNKRIFVTALQQEGGGSLTK